MLLLPLIIDYGLVMQNTFKDAQFRVDRERSSRSTLVTPTAASVLSKASVSQSPDDPSAAAMYTVKFQTSNALLAVRDLIIFTLDEEFYVPANLDVNQISISADAVIGGTSPAPGEWVAPLEVTMDYVGTKPNKPEVTLVVPDMDSSAALAATALLAVPT